MFSAYCVVFGERRDPSLDVWVLLQQPRGQVKDTTGAYPHILELEQPKTPKMCPFLVLSVVFGERRDPSLNVMSDIGEYSLYQKTKGARESHQRPQRTFWN